MKVPFLLGRHNFIFSNFYSLTALESVPMYTPVVVSSVTVPQYGVEGKHAVLYCSYRSVQPVYSVRWYKNGKEFFRWL